MSAIGFVGVESVFPIRKENDGFSELVVKHYFPIDHEDHIQLLCYREVEYGRDDVAERCLFIV